MTVLPIDLPAEKPAAKPPEKAVDFSAQSLINGKAGVAAMVNFRGHSGWNGHYEFQTHGLTADQIVGKVDDLTAYHAKKCARLDGFSAVVGVEFVINLAVYRIVDCTVWERGANVETYVDVRRIIGAAQARVPQFPLKTVYPTIDDVPADAAIVALVRARLGAVVAAQDDHADVIAEAKRLLGSP